MMTKLRCRRVLTWIKMILGLSIKHVNQGVGRCYSHDDIKGYYNDLTLKILKLCKKNRNILPKLILDNGSSVEFPIQIFQHGLAAYDLYLLTKEKNYYETFMKSVNWAVDKQNPNGSWNNFGYIYPNSPYSSMAQGEATSLLVRAFIETHDVTFRNAADKAISFMLLSIDKGGTTSYIKDDVFLHEFTHKSVVLNGWLFSIFGLLDYYKLTKSTDIKAVLDNTVNTLSKNLHHFVINDWSYYNLDRSIIASRFYHNLHKALLFVYADIFNQGHVIDLLDMWESNYRFKTRVKYFIIKAKQKLREEQ